MRLANSDYARRIGLIIVGLLVVAGIVYLAVTTEPPTVPSDELPKILRTSTQIALTTSTPTSAISTSTPEPAETAIPSSSVTATATSSSSPDAAATLPAGGIVYALSPDINSVGWVRDEEQGNHFGESHLYTGIREGLEYHGALQFDLSFIQDGSTIFLAELELTGLNSEGLTDDSKFDVNILNDDLDEGWSRQDFASIRNASVEDTLAPILEAWRLAEGQENKLLFNAAQRSISEERLESNRISFRLDSLFPEGWFSWDTGYGDETQGRGPLLRLGVLPPAATAAAAEPPAGSTPTPTPTFIVVTAVPTPENVLTAAAVAPILTVQATTTGTPTPIPANWVTPFVVTNTPTPQNQATAQYMNAEATAVAIVFGTPTPLPQNAFTATPTPTETSTPIFILLDGELPPASPTPTASITPQPTPTIPREIMGKIAFKSDRTGREEIYVINPDGTGLALLTNRWPYLVAELADTFSADGRFRVFTKDTIRYANLDYMDGDIKKSIGIRNDAPALFWYDSVHKVEEQMTEFGQGMAWNGVWSPTNNEIAFVSNDSADDEIWVANHDGSNVRRLTETNEAFNAREIGKDTFIAELNGHPSWSPDGTYITFWSNRTGHGQIWVMDAAGGNLYSLSRTNFNDWDPVWIKYPGIPANAQEIHIPYFGPHDPFGRDRDCENFGTQAEAQAFFIQAGGPARDLHGLDEDQDSIACEGLR